MTPFMSLSEINIQLTQLVRNERKLTHEILSYINLFETCGGHLKMGYASMHQYLTKHLGYSDDQAFRRLKAARLIRQMPEVSNRIQEGSLNLSQAAQAQNAFDLAERTKATEAPLSEETKKSVIAAIEKKNNFETKQILASSLDLPAKFEEHTRPQADRSVRMQFILSQQQFEKLKSVKSLLSHQIPNQGTAEVLEFVMDLFLTKKQGPSPKEKDCENQGVNAAPERKTQSSELKKLDVRKDSKKQDFAVGSEKKAVVAESQIDAQAVKTSSKSSTSSTVSAEIPSTPSIPSARIPSAPAAQSVASTIKPSSSSTASVRKPSTSSTAVAGIPSTHSTSSKKIPMSKATSLVACDSELIERCDLSRTRAAERGSCSHSGSTESFEAQAADGGPLFNRTDRSDIAVMTDSADGADIAPMRNGADIAPMRNGADIAPMTRATLETRRQCGKDFVQTSEQASQQYVNEGVENHTANSSQNNLPDNSHFKSDERSERASESKPILMKLTESREPSEPTVKKSREPSEPTVKKSTDPSVTKPKMTKPTVTKTDRSPLSSNRTKMSSRYIAIKIKQEVWRRAGGCCEHRNADGHRCQSRYQLQFDHIKAHSNGGSNGSDNLQLFCRTHNLWKATQEGIGFDSTPLFSLVGN